MFKKTLRAKPFLKWVGGKGRLLVQYQQFFPAEYGTYYEPFVGGGAVFFSLGPKKARINDANHALMSAYQNVKDNLDFVITQLKKLERRYNALDEEAQKEFYYMLRKSFNELHDEDPAKTPLLLFLNRTCFNGLYRENSKGEFNVPFGRYKNPRILDEANLAAVSAALQKTSISSVSFEKAVKSAKAGDFIYFDPPYHPLNQTSNFTSYHEFDFSSQDQVKLHECFQQLSDRGCLVMLSNSDTKFIRDLYKDFKIHTVLAGRAINSVGSKRGKIKELVITNY